MGVVIACSSAGNHVFDKPEGRFLVAKSRRVHNSDNVTIIGSLARTMMGCFDAARTVSPAAEVGERQVRISGWHGNLTFRFACYIPYPLVDRLNLAELLLCRFLPVPDSAPTKFLPPSGRAAWAKCIARDTALKREVALKALPATFLRDAERMARFQREAEVLASLDHPNIGHIYGIVMRKIRVGSHTR